MVKLEGGGVSLWVGWDLSKVRTGDSQESGQIFITGAVPRADL